MAPFLLDNNFIIRINILNIIKKVYQKHILFALQNFKQPIFSTKYAIQSKLTNSLILDQLSNDISNYFLFKTELIVNKLTSSFIKPLIFGKYFEEIQKFHSFYHSIIDLLNNTLSISLNTNYDHFQESINLKEIFSIYQDYKSCHNFSMLKDIIKINK